LRSIGPLSGVASLRFGPPARPINADVSPQPGATVTLPNSGIPLSEWSGSGATGELHETIKNFNVAAEAQTRQMIRLTKVIIGLTVVMLIMVGVQIAVAIKALPG
jgi:hypothetical protein